MSFFADFPKGPEERVASQEVVETMISDEPLPREQTETTRLHLMAERWDGMHSNCMCSFL